MEKKSLKNKAESKKEVKNKASKVQSIDFSKLGPEVKIIALKSDTMIKGKEYNVSNNVAKILIGKGVAKLK